MSRWRLPRPQWTHAVRGAGMAILAHEAFIREGLLPERYGLIAAALAMIGLHEAAKRDRRAREES